MAEAAPAVPDNVGVRRPDKSGLVISPAMRFGTKSMAAVESVRAAPPIFARPPPATAPSCSNSANHALAGLRGAAAPGAVHRAERAGRARRAHEPSDGPAVPAFALPAPHALAHPRPASNAETITFGIKTEFSASRGGGGVVDSAQAGR